MDFGIYVGHFHPFYVRIPERSLFAFVPEHLALIGQFGWMFYMIIQKRPTLGVRVTLFWSFLAYALFGAVKNYLKFCIWWSKNHIKRQALSPKKKSRKFFIVTHTKILAKLVRLPQVCVRKKRENDLCFDSCNFFEVVISNFKSSAETQVYSLPNKRKLPKKM